MSRLRCALAPPSPARSQRTPLFALDLHLGWNFFGHASLEAAVQGTTWSLFNSDRGGGGCVGGRVTWYPMQIFLSPKRAYDVGVELGGGYSIAGAPSGPGSDTSFGMDGGYFQMGLTGEYRVSKFVGLAANFRYFIPNWNKFYVDYNHSVSAPVSGVSSGWFTMTVGVNLHVSPSQG